MCNTTELKPCFLGQRKEGEDYTDAPAKLPKAEGAECEASRSIGTHILCVGGGSACGAVWSVCFAELQYQFLLPYSTTSQ